MIIGIISAIDGEIRGFIDGMEDAVVTRQAMLDYHKGRFGGKEIVAVAGGVCKVNAAIAAQVMIDRLGATHIIMCGVAGAIDPGLAIADTVIGTDYAYHDVAPGILTEDHPRLERPYFGADPALLAAAKQAVEAAGLGKTVPFGRIVTGEAFIDREGREEIIAAHDPLCVDMETAAVAHVCHANDVPFLAIRSISDTPHQSGDAAFRQYFRSAARRSVEVLRLVLSQL